MERVGEKGRNPEKNLKLLVIMFTHMPRFQHQTWNAVKSSSRYCVGISFGARRRKVSEDDGKKFVDFLIGVNGDLNGILHALSHVARYAKARSGIL